MKLHKASLFALYAVLELARDPERQLSATDIAEQYGISTHHLAKVLRTLVRAGLVQAVRGVGGGYRFTGVPNRTTLLDVISLFETLESELDAPNPSAEASRAVVEELQSITREIDDLTKAVLDTITLETALNSVRLRAGLGAPPDGDQAPEAAGQEGRTLATR
ncbi:BadM/Rrf2 family transcriptional regulator [Geothermobacter ehrlichii]|uniref:BadM/Rrf2 family transcriptional regulator n=1 Tax=Geothermobacter ehrlichii TaxID=213224 RepID=A0A5D3WL55_9BACT|nr:Rrf2 family transcriptional regulator [Geothermobacter ehrlichii]TYO99390.1 BadM/Rrf2 family transcriptional regulator [Geothermobacter ehrlichii]